MESTADIFNRLIIQRRSVFPRQFDTTRKVDDALIEQIMINATWAPNHGQSEPWFFRVYTGEGLKILSDLQSSLYRQYAGDLYKEDKYLKLKQQPLLASHVISIGMKRTTSKKIPEVEDIAAVACAVENIYLSVTAYGLGGYWTTGGITYLEEAKYQFGLGELDRLMGFFYIAHVAIPSPRAIRKPIEEKVVWVRE